MMDGWMDKDKGPPRAACASRLEVAVVECGPAGELRVAARRPLRGEEASALALGDAREGAVAVALWSFAVLVLDAASLEPRWGKQLAAPALPRSLAFLGDCLLAGLADGRVLVADPPYAAPRALLDLGGPP